MMWNREKETLSRDEYAKVQFEGLKKSLNRVSRLYWSKLKRKGDKKRARSNLAINSFRIVIYRRINTLFLSSENTYEFMRSNR